MKIYGIYLIDSVITGGNQRYIELLEGLAERENKVAVFINSKIKNKFKNCKTFSFDIQLTKHKRISIQTAKKLYGFLKSNKINTADFIIIFGETDWKSSLILRKFCNAKIIFAYRSDIIEENKMFFKYANLNLKTKAFLLLKTAITRCRELSIRKKADRIVFQTDNDKNNFLYRNQLAEKRCNVIRNDILRPRFKTEFKDKNTSTECKNLLFVGSYDIRKGLTVLLNALTILKKNNIHFMCTIAAKGNIPKQTKNFINVNNLTENLTFKEDVIDAQPVMIYHDLVIVPSLFDSYPNVIMEALHTGTPVIASNSSGIPYMLNNNELLFQTASYENLAAKLKNIINDKTYYIRLKKLCSERKSFFEFDWIKEWESLLK